MEPEYGSVPQRGFGKSNSSIGHQEVELARFLGKLTFLARHPHHQIIDAVQVDITGNWSFAKSAETETQLIVGVAIAIEVEVNIPVLLL